MWIRPRFKRSPIESYRVLSGPTAYSSGPAALKQHIVCCRQRSENMGQASNTFLTKWHETFVTGMGFICFRFACVGSSGIERRNNCENERSWNKRTESVQERHKKTHCGVTKVRAIFNICFLTRAPFSRRVPSTMLVFRFRCPSSRLL